MVGIIGDPVAHSLSPVLHNAAFAAAGMDWVYVAFPVVTGRGGDAVEAMRALGIRGLSVTMPHKAAAALAADRCEPAAARLGVANTLTLHGTEVVADATDGPGLIDSLRTDLGFQPRGRRCLVLGTGGASRSVVLALAEAGAAAVVVVGRHHDAADACAALAGPVGSVGEVAEVGDAELIVNATPVGMTGTAGDGLPFDLDPGRLGPGQVVVDLIYAPSATTLLQIAGARGATVANGLGMLVHQAARQWAIWTAARPPVDVMAAAAAEALAG